MNAQEYYDLLVKTSREGGFPALLNPEKGKGECAYRSPDGKRCAIGLVIPDEEYRSSFDPSPVSDLPFWGAIEEGKPPDWWPVELDLYEASRIQEAHDNTSHDIRRSGEGWSHEDFVTRLNEIDYFDGCVKETPSADEPTII